MNRIEHLLVCLIEECSEVQKEASKALRFGIDDTNPNTGVVNKDAIASEFNDLYAVFDMLCEEGVLNYNQAKDLDDMRTKKAKVEKFMVYAKEVGALEVNTKDTKSCEWEYNDRAFNESYSPTCNNGTSVIPNIYRTWVNCPYCSGVLKHEPK